MENYAINVPDGYTPFHRFIKNEDLTDFLLSQVWMRGKCTLLKPDYSNLQDLAGSAVDESFKISVDNFRRSNVNIPEIDIIQ